jgi:hypothetical protein
LAVLKTTYLRAKPNIILGFWLLLQKCGTTGERKTESKTIFGERLLGPNF